MSHRIESGMHEYFHHLVKQLRTPDLADFAAEARYIHGRSEEPAEPDDGQLLARARRLAQTAEAYQGPHKDTVMKVAEQVVGVAGSVPSALFHKR